MRRYGFWIVLGGAAVAALVGALMWQPWVDDDLPTGFAAGNGRIEAVEIDLATQTAGQLREVMVREGDGVERDQPVAQMETAGLEARLHEAEARLERARIGTETARNRVSQRESERAAAEARVAQRQAQLEAARKSVERTRTLVERGSATPARLDEDEATFEGSRAAVNAARAEVASVKAALASARSAVTAARADVQAAQATVERIRTDIDDALLRAPRDGRVQYRVAEPGEVLAAGGTVLNMIDLTDVYMTFFLPTEQAGRLAIGAEARIVLTAAREYVIPAEVSFVADESQFTPKTVETREERARLMFRVRASIDPELLREYLRQVKTGLPGMAYVRLDADQDWPDDLQVNLPQ
ncbi:glycoside hydrolase family 43 [Gammaproteobacteria bacterium 2W06]|nr:glycoside hydrolase family 43 [Gammaproteobacteria bacterium 2W06]